MDWRDFTSDLTSKVTGLDFWLFYGDKRTLEDVEGEFPHEKEAPPKKRSRADENCNREIENSIPKTEGGHFLTYWMNVLKNEGIVLCDHVLIFKVLSLVSKSVSSVARDWVQDNLWFYQHKMVFGRECFYPVYQKRIKYRVYKPKLMKDVTNTTQLPSSLTHIIFDSSFNANVDSLPSSITSITFGKNFQQSVDKLPKNLTELVLSHKFNLPVDHLPQKLRKLTFGYLFNSLVDNLPHSLTHLIFSNNFNLKVNHLPPNLTWLEFGFWYNKSSDKLPNRITYLRFGNRYNENIDKLPPKLIQLIMGYRFSKTLSNLPHTITQLTLSHDFNQTLNNLPPNLTHLTLTLVGNHSDQILESIPLTIQNVQVIFECNYNKPIDHLSPRIQFLQRVDDYSEETKKYQYNPQLQ